MKFLVGGAAAGKDGRSKPRPYKPKSKAKWDLRCAGWMWGEFDLYVGAMSAAPARTPVEAEGLAFG